MTDTSAPRRPGILPMISLNDLTRETIKRECAGPSEIETDFERCDKNPGGHLYFHGWCLHCHCEEP